MRDDGPAAPCQNARVVYTGRFAPSPTGPLHAGSLATALASWLDARAHAGTWLVRIEDVDTTRCIPGMDRHILWQLARCQLLPDAPVIWQTRRTLRYAAALDQLAHAARAYPCACSRKDVIGALAAQGRPPQRGRALVYPGTCRPERGGLAGRPARAWRLHTGRGPGVRWHDRRLGWQQQDVQAEVGDFVLRRADGLWAYQLAVVVDDAAQGVTDVVRGADLADNTARQILLQRALGLPTPRYLHAPLVRAANGDKLSKQSGAAEVDLADPARALAGAARHLGLRVTAGGRALPDLLQQLTARWQEMACAAQRLRIN